MSEKPTADDLELIARFCDGVTHHYDEDRARIRKLLDAYEATQRPIEASPDAPLDVAALPAFWDARRAALGKNASVCAAELRRALAHAATPAEPRPDFDYDRYMVTGGPL